MPTVLLNGDDRVVIASGPLHATARFARSGEPVRQVAESGGAPVDRLQHPTPALMIVPRVTGTTVLRVLPAEGASTFPDGATVNLALQVRAAGGQDPDIVQINAVDVSGLPSRDLARVEPDPRGLVVTALDAVLDDALVGLPGRVRAEARGRFPVGGPAGRRAGALLVGVDVSASMRPVHEEGSVDAVLQLLRGLSYVVGRPGELGVALVGERATWLPPVPVQELGDQVRTAVAAAGAEVGFEPCFAVPSNSSAHTLFLVTDAMPADPAALVAASDADGVRRHVVAVSPDGRPPAGPVSGVHHTRVEPPSPGTRATDHLLASPTVLASLVTSLLEPWTTSPSDTTAGASR